jgi:hypothetical protein
MVVQEKNQGGIRICVDLRKLNDAYLHDPFPTPFIDEVLENVGGQEAYSFTDGFLGNHQIKIVPEDRYKTTCYNNICLTIAILHRGPFSISLCRLVIHF